MFLEGSRGGCKTQNTLYSYGELGAYLLTNNANIDVISNTLVCVIDCALVFAYLCVWYRGKTCRIDRVSLYRNKMRFQVYRN